MEACSGLWNLAIRLLRDLCCCLIARLLPKLLAHSPTSARELQEEDGHVHPPHTTAAECTLPELPQDILMDIFATFEIPDLVRAGSVCSQWHSAYTTLRDLGKYKLSQTPCLLYTSESAADNVASLYSLAENRTYKLTLPAPSIHSRYLIGSSHGWLITVDDRSEMHLVNPITGEQIALPSVTTIEHVKPIFDKSGVLYKYEYSWHTATRVFYTPSEFDVDMLREYLQYKAFMFPETLKGSYIAVLIHNPNGQLSFARIGDDKWTWLPPHTDYEDCNYKDGLLYAINRVGQVHAFDLSGPVPTIMTIVGRMQDLNGHNMYLVLAPWGDLLNVFRTPDYEGDEDPYAEPSARHTAEIKIFKLDTMAKSFVEFKSIHDHVLFLGHNQSLCLSAKEHPPLKPNHAYFTDNYDLWTYGFKNQRRDIGIFDLENNVRDELLSPQLWSNWPTPVWITPSLATMKMK